MKEIKNDIDKECWIIITWLSLILLGVLFLTLENCIGCLYLENTIILIQLK